VAAICWRSADQLREITSEPESQLSVLIRFLVMRGASCIPSRVPGRRDGARAGGLPLGADTARWRQLTAAGSDRSLLPLEVGLFGTGALRLSI
jgi:hypothetical protein